MDYFQVSLNKRELKSLISMKTKLFDNWVVTGVECMFFAAVTAIAYAAKPVA